MSHELFLLFWFQAFESKMSCLRERNKALKASYFPIHFKIQSLKSLKTGIFECKMTHGGSGVRGRGVGVGVGSGKCQKSVTYYLNGPYDEIIKFERCSLASKSLRHV